MRGGETSLAEADYFVNVVAAMFMGVGLTTTYVALIFTRPLSKIGRNASAFAQLWQASAALNLVEDVQDTFSWRCSASGAFTVA